MRSIARLVHHSSKVKRPHWHIDYLLQLPQAKIIEVRLFEAASDCRNRCESHLKYRGPKR